MARPEWAKGLKFLGTLLLGFGMFMVACAAGLIVIEHGETLYTAGALAVGSLMIILGAPLFFWKRIAALREEERMKKSTSPS